MATVTEPIVLDKSINTTEQTPRNIADVLAEELKGIADSITTAENVENILTDMATTKTAPTINGTAVFDTVDGNFVKALKVAVTPSQDLHGYSNPWVGGAGKNKMPITATSQTISHVTITVNADGSFHASGTATADIYLNLGETSASANTWTGSCGVVGSWSSYGIYIRNVTDDVTINMMDSQNYTFTLSATKTIRFILLIRSGQTINTDFYPMLRLSTETDSTFEPYENICPISGHTQEVISVKDSTDTTQATYTTAFGQTVYGGTLDVLSGELMIDRKYKSGFTRGAIDSSGKLYKIDELSDAVNITSTSGVADLDESNMGIFLGLTSARASADFCLAHYATSFYVGGMVGKETELDSLLPNLEIVYELATPTTLSLTPQKVKSLVGENHISASTGDVLECKFSMLINGDDLAILLS